MSDVIKELGEVINNIGKSIVGLKNKEESILDEAKQLVYGERQEQYGDFKEAYEPAAEFWSTYLGKKISVKDVMIMMTLLKISREKSRSKRDNLVDACGYLDMAYRSSKEKK